jgi:hypothetical protein
VRTEFTYNGPMGTMNLEMSMLEHKEFNGILSAVKTKVKMMGMEFTVSVEDIKHNVELPPDRFKAPKEIRELVAKKEQPAESK